MGAGPDSRRDRRRGVGYAETAVINLVGLSPKLLGPHMPQLSRWAKEASLTRIRPALPAVTCTAQANYLTGTYPETHGIVGNGWYFRDECEIKFWRQSNKLMEAPKIWEVAKAADPSFTCANLFWWYNMYLTADYSVTPRPMYPADGRKLPDVYTDPPELRSELQQKLGTFPLFDFWGPRASIRSTRWIAECAKQVDAKFNPTLTLIYLPHLDYGMQRLGSATGAIQKDLQEADEICGDLISYYESRGAQVVVLSEYAIVDVQHPIHINRALREHGLIAVREELGLELLDPGASAAFAVADHQIAHVYVNEPARVSEVRAIMEQLPGVEEVLDRRGMAARHIAHPRAGELFAIARQDAWFTYYYWLDDRKAPDFARTVEIHRKPGYDPVELFLDPKLKIPMLSVGWKVLKRKMGLRSLLDVIPLDAALVRGSHGRADNGTGDCPVFLSRHASVRSAGSMDSTELFAALLNHLGLDQAVPHILERV